MYIYNKIRYNDIKESSDLFFFLMDHSRIWGYPVFSTQCIMLNKMSFFNYDIRSCVEISSRSYFTLSLIALKRGRVKYNRPLISTQFCHLQSTDEVSLIFVFDTNYRDTRSLDPVQLAACSTQSPRPWHGEHYI